MHKAQTQYKSKICSRQRQTSVSTSAHIDRFKLQAHLEALKEKQPHHYHLYYHPSILESSLTLSSTDVLLYSFIKDVAIACSERSSGFCKPLFATLLMAFSLTKMQVENDEVKDGTLNFYTFVYNSGEHLIMRSCARARAEEAGAVDIAPSHDSYFRQ